MDTSLRDSFMDEDESTTTSRIGIGKSFLRSLIHLLAVIRVSRRTTDKNWKIYLSVQNFKIVANWREYYNVLQYSEASRWFDRSRTTWKQTCWMHFRRLWCTKSVESCKCYFFQYSEAGVSLYWDSYILLYSKPTLSLMPIEPWKLERQCTDLYKTCPLLCDAERGAETSIVQNFYTFVRIGFKQQCRKNQAKVMHALSV